MIDILSLTLEELTEEIVKISQPKYRAKQIYEWLHLKKVSDFSEMTVLPVGLRASLQETFHIKSLTVQRTLVSDRKDTVKYLYCLDDGNKIETVVMSHRHGNSLCISSQVGCKMGCGFCASGIAGFVRNLSPSEMLLQLYESEKQSGGKIDSIVIMGVGEPLDNFDNLLKFFEILQSGHGMSLRHVSLSTCGLVDKIDALAKLKLGLTLSVSLHAVSDEARSAIMPINRQFGLERLLKSCSDYFYATKRRVSFEYALINGENDNEIHARELVRLLSRMQAGSYHVNLIPVNQLTETRFKPSESENVKKFANFLEKCGVTVTVRRIMGKDINAACGQLRRS